MKHPRGMILFLTLLILGVTATAVILLLSQSSVNGFLSVDEKIKSDQVRAQVFGCLDEVLIQLSADASYNPATVDLATYTCDASIQTNADERTVTLARVSQNITRRIVAVVNVGVLPITVSSILEQ